MPARGPRGRRLLFRAPSTVGSWPGGTDELLAAGEADGAKGALTIADLYGEVEGRPGHGFPRGRRLWVRGEVHSVSDQSSRTGHCYLDLIDPETAAGEAGPGPCEVKILAVHLGAAGGPPWAREGIELTPGMVVVIRGTLDFYRPRAEVGFILAELDVTALLGRLAAERAALLRALAAEGLLERNRALPVPPVPLRVGLVASPGTEGYRDFLGQLEGSGFSFQVTLVPTTVQGADAPAALAGAVSSLSALGPDRLDVVALVHGGGSKADLAAFDAEAVARAVATSSVPVWTGIGHTGDESVADLVANRCCITPTECGRELALRVGQWWETRVAAPAALLRRRAAEALASADQRDHAARVRLAVTARHLVAGQAERLCAQARAVARLSPRVAAEARGRVGDRALRLGPLALGHLERAEVRSASWRRLLAAYDVDRQLERGYTLTYAESGAVVRSVAALASGTALTTRGSPTARCDRWWSRWPSRWPGHTAAGPPGRRCDGDQARAAGPEGSGVEGLSYAEASRELDEIVAFFEGRDVDVDQLVAGLDPATAIVDELDRRLRRTRAQVEELVPRLGRGGRGKRGGARRGARDRGGARRGRSLGRGARRGDRGRRDGFLAGALLDGRGPRGRRRPPLLPPALVGTGLRPTPTRSPARWSTSSTPWATARPARRFWSTPPMPWGELLDALAADDMTCVEGFGTHYHPDHLGGSMAGFSIDGDGLAPRTRLGPRPRPA